MSDEPPKPTEPRQTSAEPLPAAAPAPLESQPGESDRDGVWRMVRLLALVAAVLLVLWLSRKVITPFVVAAVIAYAFDPLVARAQAKTRWPRILIVAIGYVVAFCLIGGIVYFAAGRIADEIHELSTSGGDIVAAALQRLAGDSFSIGGQQYRTADIAKQIEDAIKGSISSPGSAIRLIQDAADVALQAMLTLILAFYLLLDGDRFLRFALRFMDRRRQAQTVEIAARIHLVLGRWLRGQLFLIALVAAVLYVVLGPILGVPYSLTLAIVSGVLEIIPLVGPIVAAAIAVSIAFAHGGPNLALTVLVIYFIVRQVEDQVVMPVVIGRAVHLHPVVTIFAVLVGLSAFGIIGGLLGVPVAAAVNVTLRELYPEATREPELFEQARRRGEDPMRSAQARAEAKESAEATPEAADGR